MTNPVKSGIQSVDKTHSTTPSAASAKIEEDLESQKSLEAENTGIDWMEKEHFIPFTDWQFVYKRPNMNIRHIQHRQIKRGKYIYKLIRNKSWKK